MFTGLVFYESPLAVRVANAGFSPSTALSVLDPYQLMVSSIWATEKVKIFIASTTLRATAITSTKARYALGSGSVIVQDMEARTPTQVGIQFPGSLLRKFLSHNLKVWSLAAVSEACSRYEISPEPWAYRRRPSLSRAA